MTEKPTVIDFFCGAGGFSEGFRQQGFKILMGIDNWSPAIETHNINHGLNDSTKDVLDFESIEEIDLLPDTEVIVGSPPCVLFSLSNKGGKADKTLGIRLFEAFLKVVAVKKHQQNSKLKAWFMENVPNSKNYVRNTYTFHQLGLSEWATKLGLNPDSVALNVGINGRVLNTADFGVSQKRERFVCGEIVSTGEFPELGEYFVSAHRSIKSIREKMPKPNAKKVNKVFTDPNYPSVKYKMEDITDHFYDSGVYRCQWEKAKYLKLNHPFMGKMSFPENDNNPSRTIMATQSASTRESLLYRSEYNRTGDGEYRLPTVREVATLMGFPYSYQFSGSETTKWRQVGNAVCPSMSSALAVSVRKAIGLKKIPLSKVSFKPSPDIAVSVENLNTFKEKVFDKPPKKKNDAKFRRHPFKDGNMTVALTNYHPSNDSYGDWYSSVFLGSGKDFIVKNLPRKHYRYIASVIKERHPKIGERFIVEFETEFKNIIGKADKFQGAYVGADEDFNYEPAKIVGDIGDFILKYDSNLEEIELPELIPEKKSVPIRQVLAMYAINRILA